MRLEEHSTRPLRRIEEANYLHQILNTIMWVMPSIFKHNMRVDIAKRRIHRVGMPSVGCQLAEVS